MGAEVGSLPGLGAFSHMGGSAFEATAHAAVHDAFMTLPPYTRTSEGEVHELGLGVRNCSHRARFNVNVSHVRIPLHKEQIS